MQCRTFSNKFHPCTGTHDIHQEIVADDEGDQVKYRMFQHPAKDFLRVPWLFIQRLLAMRITINPVFDPPENHFHEHGLRARPSAPDSSIGYGKKDDEYHQRDHPDKKEVEILGPELNAKDYKCAVEKIKQQQLLPIDFDKGGAEKEYHQQYAGDIPCSGQRPFWFFRKYPKSFAAFIDGVQPVAKAA